MRELKKMSFLVKLYICLYILTFAISPAYGEDIDGEILVIGSGEIEKNNLAGARKLAISDAHVKGIETYLVKILGDKGMINNFENIINEIIPGSGDVIENYKILAEDSNSKSYKILVSIKVNEKLMEEKLRDSGIVLYEGVSLRVLFLVSDRSSLDELPFIWWDDPENKTNLSSSERILHSVFQERGFNPVNRLFSVPESGYNPELFKEELTVEDAAEWGHLYSADVVILGNVDVSASNSIVVHMKAVQVKNAVVAASFDYDRIFGDDSESTGTRLEMQQKILSEGAAKIIPDILKAFKKEEEKLTRFDLELKGLDSLRQVVDFISFLKEKVSGVVSVVQTRITHGSIKMSVEFSGDRKMFIEKIRSSGEIPFAAGITIDASGTLIFTGM